jgi:DNA-binding transcriptional regulator LsrR (DeoR family)
MAGGEAKTAATRAVLRARAVTSVLTDAVVAAKLLDQKPPTEGRRR